MTDQEFRESLLASVASRAEVQSCGGREAFASEMLERLREAGEVPDADPCAETLEGPRNRRLELDAWADDEADESLHLFLAIYDGRAERPLSMSLSEARDQGFGRLLNVFNSAREGWFAVGIEESRPIWELGRRISAKPLPAALRLHVLTDRPASERIREIAETRTSEGVPVTFQIWDVTRLKRIHEATNVRDDLVVDFSALPGGGLHVLEASVGSGDYEGYLAVIAAEALARVYLHHGSRLLEGNVRTFLGRRGKVNVGISRTVADTPERFFAYNNGIAATASAVVLAEDVAGLRRITAAHDLQIVNGAQTTASLATALRDGRLPEGKIFVSMKLSVVAPDIASELIPLISRFANTQNAVRASDFFANHPFHRRIEQISRRVLAPSVGGVQIQSHWYYERARGQHLNDQAGLTAAKRRQFELENPRRQLIKKTDLAKVETSFALEPEVTCKGNEKAFASFAERIAKEWQDEAKRALYGDDWFKAAVARVILFRKAEEIISKAPWYAGGHRAKIVAYACAGLAHLARSVSGGGTLDYAKVWGRQSAGDVLEKQLARVGEVMATVILHPPTAGQDVGEWAKQPACRKNALEAEIERVDGLEQWVIGADQERSSRRQAKRTGLVDAGFAAVVEAMRMGNVDWQDLRRFCREQRILMSDEERQFFPVVQSPMKAPTEVQARRLLEIRARAEKAGWSLSS